LIALSDVTKVALIAGTLAGDRAIRANATAFIPSAVRTTLYFLSLVILFFCVSNPGYASPHKTRTIVDRPLADLKKDKAMELFVHANIEFTLLHELAHMFFDLYEVPLLGSEENAADRVAITAILTNATAADGYTAEQKLLAVAANWHADWDSMKELQRSYANSDSHSQEIERANTVACFVYGSDPDKYADLIYSRIMPFKRYTECEDEYEQALKSITWLNRHYSRRFPDLTVDELAENRPVRISVEFDRPKKLHRKGAIDYLVKKYRYERVAEMIEEKYRLPTDIKIVFGMCRGRANAAWNTVYKQVTICYELINRFFEMYEQAKKHQAEGCRHPSFKRVLEPYVECVPEPTELMQSKN